jgi:hypothetical protein
VTEERRTGERRKLTRRAMDDVLTYAEIEKINNMLFKKNKKLEGFTDRRVCVCDRRSGMDRRVA